MSKAKVISVLNHKGGVGKTTTTINLGGALRQKGYKVLLIDLDGQANLTESLGFSAELPQTIYGAMKGEYPLPARGRTLQLPHALGGERWLLDTRAGCWRCP